MIYRGTTPTHIFSFPFEQNEVAVLKISYFQKGTVKFTKTLENVTFDQVNSTIELKRLQEDFDQKWVCPKCKRPLTCFRSYTILSQNDACPFCKTKFEK